MEQGPVWFSWLMERRSERREGRRREGEASGG
jgi:hypothetical protein